ncbi:Hypothetical predicted protein [Octopus vulgaris]|uniref:Glycerol-3-phosphate phosphatase n=2 Tax=Octopus TaxID=6643 RepID=A0AA36F2R5_OCTVU|nr:Hypothetical predicted protein [Octopus vulgaris]
MRQFTSLSMHSHERVVGREESDRRQCNKPGERREEKNPVKNRGYPDPTQGTLSEWLNINFDPEIKCVLVGFDQHISYIKILKAASYIKKKKCLFIATNEDSNLPIPGDVIIPGTMVSAVKVPSQTNPVVIGKPHPVIIELLKKRDGLNPSRALMVGDRLNTDIAFAKNHKLKSLLVLSGISNLEDIQEAEKNPSDENPYPDYYLPSLAEFSQLLPN